MTPLLIWYLCLCNVDVYAGIGCVREAVVTDAVWFRGGAVCVRLLAASTPPATPTPARVTSASTRPSLTAPERPWMRTKFHHALPNTLRKVRSHSRRRVWPPCGSAHRYTFCWAGICKNGGVVKVVSDICSCECQKGFADWDCSRTTEELKAIAIQRATGSPISNPCEWYFTLVHTDF